MEEFINWDVADPAVGTVLDVPWPQTAGAASDALDSLDLALEAADGDSFSFWALEHFDTTHVSPGDLDNRAQTQPQAFEYSFEFPEAPCAHCQSGGYQCKKINEGQYKGYCTSCVALRCGCSFGLAEPEDRPSSVSFPVNPWPTLGDHPDAPQEGPQSEHFHSLSAPNLPSLAPDKPLEPQQPGALSLAPAPKAGARFSRESVKILKNWLSVHNRHPYPSDEEKQILQNQTGLTKSQISNWLANARRRGKIIPPRSTSPGVRNWSGAIDIPGGPRPRPGTPAALENMNPLQRWQYSPPENEPASVAAIARAVTASTTTSSGLNSPHSVNFTDDGTGRSLCAGSSASSIPTSHSSGGSFASAYSHASRGSFGSLGSFNRGRRRRRRRATSKRPEDKTALTGALKTYQCTFCTETFRTKHDWQRHEKSLHLSLERWVCAPHGPRAPNPGNNQVCCVFCGQADPDDAHYESHDYPACQERSLEERTFYRKDHLRQHLKLVHDCKFTDWSMESWRLATPEIRSRCGFCGIVMDTWSIRVDHLAEHFKGGNTMADWKGDWGFEAPVLSMVENSIPPYLIHDERNTPLPYEASRMPIETPTTAYELLRTELAYFIHNCKYERGGPPTDEELQMEACRVIYGAEVLSRRGISSAPSWLRDLLLSSEQLASRARMTPIRSENDSLMSRLAIIGKDNIFDDDILEAQLIDYVRNRRLLGLTPKDSELQAEASRSLGRMEESSNGGSDEVANFLLRLVLGGSGWLAPFRQRAHLPRSEDMADEDVRSKDPNTIDSTIHNYNRLEAELAEFVQTQRRLGSEPSDADLQRHARLIIYELDDAWNQTAADDAQWLGAFKKRHMQSPGASAGQAMGGLSMAFSLAAQQQTDPLAPARSPAITRRAPPAGTVESCGYDAQALPQFFVSETNCYRKLARHLGRYAVSVMSPNNPNRHVPTDEELRHQARWILYDDDDPWNQTAADNDEWLRRFKKDVGILTDPSLPGLPYGCAWDAAPGRSGAAPAYK